MMNIERETGGNRWDVPHNVYDNENVTRLYLFMLMSIAGEGLHIGKPSTTLRPVMSARIAQLPSICTTSNNAFAKHYNNMHMYVW